MVLTNHTTALMLAAGMTWRDGGGAFPTRDRANDEGTLDTMTVLLARGLDINAVNDAGRRRCTAPCSVGRLSSSGSCSPRREARCEERAGPDAARCGAEPS